MLTVYVRVPSATLYVVEVGSAQVLAYVAK